MPAMVIISSITQGKPHRRECVQPAMKTATSKRKYQRSGKHRRPNFNAIAGPLDPELLNLFYSHKKPKRMRSTRGRPVRNWCQKLHAATELMTHYLEREITQVETNRFLCKSRSHDVVRSDWTKGSNFISAVSFKYADRFRQATKMVVLKRQLRKYSTK